MTDYQIMMAIASVVIIMLNLLTYSGDKFKPDRFYRILTLLTVVSIAYLVWFLYKIITVGLTYVS